MSIVLIDSRALERECLMRGIEAGQPKIAVQAFKFAANWVAAMNHADMPNAILYNTEGRCMADRQVKGDVSELIASGPAPVVVLSPAAELSEMIAAIDLGAGGYIPASLGIEATLIAVRLAGLGAICVPAASILAARNMLTHREVPEGLVDFTSRQAAVADGLRRGKPNKLIAYHLNMCESTVKVHIRNIMKKLHARNRTEAGYKLNLLLPDPAALPRLSALVERGTGAEGLSLEPTPS